MNTTPTHQLTHGAQPRQPVITIGDTCYKCASITRKLQDNNKGCKLLQPTLLHGAAPLTERLCGSDHHACRCLSW
jgi:hypothetical protein